jgi:rRNA maturation endonuclease Nob1
MSQEIETTQLQLTVLIGGVERQRIRYGEEAEDWEADRQPCHDCGVIKGQLHVFGCDVERCPVCGGQLAFCECDD